MIEKRIMVISWRFHDNALILPTLTASTLLNNLDGQNYAHLSYCFISSQVLVLSYEICSLIKITSSVHIFLAIKPKSKYRGSCLPKCLLHVSQNARYHLSPTSWNMGLFKIFHTDTMSINNVMSLNSKNIWTLNVCEHNN